MTDMTYHLRPTAHEAALDPRGERGMAIVVALMTMLLMSALGLGLMLTTSTETLLTGNYRDNTEALYAADAAIERVLQDMLVVPDWNTILVGSERSAFVDGAPSGARALPTGGSLDLTKATNMLNCGKVTACSAADMDTWSAERPWTTNNPRWQLYAYGPLSKLLESGSVVSSMYVVVWVSDDPSETDNDPTKDATGQVTMHAEAFGPGGVHKVIEVDVARTDTSEMERGYIAQRGQDEQNLRARKSALQTTNNAVKRSEMSLSTGVLVSQ
jgi:hypothetical protein